MNNTIKANIDANASDVQNVRQLKHRNSRNKIRKTTRQNNIAASSISLASKAANSLLVKQQIDGATATAIC